MNISGGSQIGIGFLSRARLGFPYLYCLAHHFPVVSSLLFIAMLLLSSFILLYCTRILVSTVYYIRVRILSSALSIAIQNSSELTKNFYLGGGARAPQNFYRIHNCLDSLLGKMGE